MSPARHSPSHLDVELSAAAWKQIGAADRKAFQRIVEALKGFDARFVSGADLSEKVREEIDRVLRASGLQVRWHVDVARNTLIVDGLGEVPSGDHR
jgi:hypothetical protein